MIKRTIPNRKDSRLNKLSHYSLPKKEKNCETDETVNKKKKKRLNSLGRYRNKNQ